MKYIRSGRGDDLLHLFAERKKASESPAEVMLAKVLLSCALLLAALQPLLTHPLSHSTGMSYPGPVSEEEEEEQLASPGDLSFSEQSLLSQGTVGLAYPSLLRGDINREGLRTTGFVPTQLVKKMLLEKPLLNPLSRFFGARKQYQKRGGNTECFWKYCV